MTLNEFEDRWLTIIAECDSPTVLENVTRRAVQKGAMTPRITEAIAARTAELDAEPPLPWMDAYLEARFEESRDQAGMAGEGAKSADNAV
jgi:hypothetical protein